MAYKDIEIEIQVSVEKPARLIEFLDKNATFQSEKHQVDEYFSPAHRDFLKIRPVKEWLRLRDADGKFSINYKNWHYDENNKGLYGDELETRVESSEQLRKIFTALDMKPITTVDKLRKTSIYEDYEIAIDSVKSLGDFVEIEYVGIDHKVNPKEVMQGMIQFLKKTECGKIIRNHVGYPFLMLFPDEVEYEEE